MSSIDSINSNSYYAEKVSQDSSSVELDKRILEAAKPALESKKQKTPEQIALRKELKKKWYNEYRKGRRALRNAEQRDYYQRNKEVINARMKEKKARREGRVEPPDILSTSDLKQLVEYIDAEESKTTELINSVDFVKFTLNQYYGKS